MIRSIRYSVVAGVACLAGALGLTFALAAPPGGTKAAVEFTLTASSRSPSAIASGCTSAKWLPPTTSTTARPRSRVPRSLHGPRELRPLREDRQVPRRHRDHQGTQQRRGQGGDQRQGLLPGRLHRPGGLDQGLETLQGRARLVGLLQLRPQVSAQGGGGEELRQPRATSATRTTPRPTGSSASITRPCVRRPPHSK